MSAQKSIKNDVFSSENFEKSDRIREELATHGIVLEDNAKGTIWRRSG